ncbi:MAG: YraN family protein [Pseudomonadota bacterium]
MITNFRFGLFAEYFVMVWYMLRFYNVIAHRKRNFAGEIDIICQRARSLVFIEVKARSSKFDDVLCTPYQQNRIRRTAEVFLQNNPKYQNFDMRFDLVVIRPYKLPEIIENAW